MGCFIHKKKVFFMVWHIQGGLKAFGLDSKRWAFNACSICLDSKKSYSEHKTYSQYISIYSDIHISISHLFNVKTNAFTEMSWFSPKVLIRRRYFAVGTYAWVACPNQCVDAVYLPNDMSIFLPFNLFNSGYAYFVSLLIQYNFSQYSTQHWT